MNSIEVNYKDVQFLTGCTTSEAKTAIYNALDESNQRDHRLWGGVNAKVYVNSSRIALKMSSYSNEMHNKKVVEYTIGRIREKGLPTNLKREILEDVKNVLRASLCGKYATLEKVLTENQLASVLQSLERRRCQFLMAGNKIPKALERYMTPERRRKILEIT